MDITLSPIKRAAIYLLDSLKEQIITDCNDDDISRAMVKFNPANNGYFKEEDFVNYDEALHILHLSSNRSKLNLLCKRYGIKNVRFNNACVGFPRKEIEKLAEILNKEDKRFKH